MPEVRIDEITGHRVIVSEERAARPNDYSEPTANKPIRPSCQFCGGNEAQTTSEVFAIRPAGSLANTPGWRVRVIPNKYPALDDTTDPDAGTRYQKSGWGIHDVIVESPRHVPSLADLTVDEVIDVFRAYIARLEFLRRQSHVQYVQIFKNARRDAGASVEHVHSQLVAMPWLPETPARKLAAAQEYFSRDDTCIWCARRQNELAEDSRIAARTDRFLAVCPFASRFPFEVMILPELHQSDFDRVEPVALEELAKLVLRLVKRLEELRPGVAYNYILHTAPWNLGEEWSRPPISKCFHWHLEMFPRITTTAGFEWGTGCFINPVSPETAAARLRGDAS